MKLLKMKKCFIFFTLVLISILGIGNVKALDNTISIDYNNTFLQGSIERDKQYLDKVMNLVKEYEQKDSNYHFEVYYYPYNSSGSSNKFQLQVKAHYGKYEMDYFKKSFISNNGSKLEYGEVFRILGNGIYYTDLFSYFVSWGNIDNYINDAKNKLNNYKTTFTKITSPYSISSSNNKFVNLTSGEFSFLDFPLMYYSTDEKDNYGFYYGNNFNYKFIFDGKTLESGDKIPSYFKYKYDEIKEIILTKTFASDLNNNDIYNIKADFAKVYDASYRYEIKINHSDWIDVTEDINNKANDGYYFYNHITYHNTIFKARVIDMNNNVIYENEINVSELKDFGMYISHNAANDSENRYINVITIDLINCWDDNYIYQYSYDNKSFYNMNVTKDNKKYWLNHGIQTFLYFRILDDTGKIIYNKSYEEIFDGLIKNVLIKEETKITDKGDKHIVANIIFNQYSQFSDIYNLKYVINGRELVGSTGAYIYELTKTDYENFKEIQIDVYVDDFLVESVCYSPKYGDMSFDDKYDKIIEDKLDDELGNQDFTTIDGMLKAVTGFINSIKDFILTFFSLIMRFFNRLNIWIKSALIAGFVVMVICRIIKVVRK